MGDFFEIDFLDVEADKSGDAIPLRYCQNGVTTVHVVDGGFQDTGDKILDHLTQYYDDPDFIDHVVVTHPDGDHACGLVTVLQEHKVRSLWMLRPWLYADELLHRFPRFKTAENLRSRLREIYPNVAELEKIAAQIGVPIYDPFQGSRIGSFTVLAPSKSRYLDLIVESDKTPQSLAEKAVGVVGFAARAVLTILKAVWGAEKFSEEETSAENEMSVVQYAQLCGTKILLTGDVGREGLREAADYAPYVGLALPGIDKFQVPHHGSRRNVSTDILDRWLGPRLAARPASGTEKFSAYISSAKKDEKHPRKAVVRAMIHRGGAVYTTEGNSIRTSKNAPNRENWTPVTPASYPEEQED